MYDVIVIGGGPDGYAAAIRASQLDAKVEGLDFDALVGRVEGVSNDIRMGMGGGFWVTTVCR